MIPGGFGLLINSIHIYWALLCQLWLGMQCKMTSPMAQMVKRLPIMWETWVQSPGWEDLLEKEMATHSRILAWEIPWMEEAGRLQTMGSQRVGHNWVTSLSLSLSSSGQSRILFIWPLTAVRYWHVYIFGWPYPIILLFQCWQLTETSNSYPQECRK